MADTLTSGLKGPLQKQIAIEWQAHCHLQALRVWLNAEGWYQSHKTVGHLSKALQSDVNDIMKLMKRYFQVSCEVPATSACPVDCKDLLTAVEQVRDTLRAAQSGWREISAKAEDAKVMELDSYVDKKMEDLIEDIERVNSVINLYQNVQCDKSVWLDKRFGKLRLG